MVLQFEKRRHAKYHRSLQPWLDAVCLYLMQGNNIANGQQNTFVSRWLVGNSYQRLIVGGPDIDSRRYRFPLATCYVTLLIVSYCLHHHR